MKGALITTQAYSPESFNVVLVTVSVLVFCASIDITSVIVISSLVSGSTIVPL